MKKILIFSIALMFITCAYSQKYMSRNSYIGFYSHTPLEDIKADNNQVAAAFDASVGDLVFQILIKSFTFEKALMQEHFNENYMESETFPKASFKGKVLNLADISFSNPGKYPVHVEGDLNMHGVSQKIVVQGDIEVLNETVKATSNFKVKPEDYKIKIPNLVRDKIAREIEIKVDASMNLVQ